MTFESEAEVTSMSDRREGKFANWFEWTIALLLTAVAFAGRD
jgi:hypothetical protein